MRDKYEERLKDYEQEFATVHIAMGHRDILKEQIAFLKKPTEGMEVNLFITKNHNENGRIYTIPTSQYLVLAELLTSCKKETEEVLDCLMYKCDGCCNE